MREERKEVLVVGAGPVGLWTALVLANAGVQVKIIDSEVRTSARSYACALHPRSLKALDRLGLADPLISAGRRVETLGFYQGGVREAEVQLKHADGFPFLLIVPQAVLEGVLEERLRKEGVRVDWNHRLDNLARESESVSASIQELSGTSTGYVVPHWETIVRRQIPLRAQFVVGADGHGSMTRQRAMIDSQRFQEAQAFAAYEFESDEPAGSEVRVVLDDQTTNVLWPLPGNKWRWTFQVLREEAPTEFPEKDRRAVHMANKVIDDRVKDYVQRVAARRAPWFKASVKEVTWCTQVAFEQRLVERFGQDRCWLAGDAAHQTGPVGVQSMNSGLLEGEMLAHALHQIIHGEGSMDILNDYNKAGMRTWKPLLGATAWSPEPKASPWVVKRASRITSCLPGLNEDFLALAAQLGLRPAS